MSDLGPKTFIFSKHVCLFLFDHRSLYLHLLRILLVFLFFDLDQCFKLTQVLLYFSVSLLPVLTPNVAGTGFFLVVSDFTCVLSIGVSQDELSITNSAGDPHRSHI